MLNFFFQLKDLLFHNKVLFQLCCQEVALEKGGVVSVGLRTESGTPTVYYYIKQTGTP